MFCPFINNECNDDCMYRNGNVSLPDDCDLYDAIKTLQSLQSSGNAIDLRMQEISKKLTSIHTETSCDQSCSSDINDKLESVLKILHDIKKNI